MSRSAAQTLESLLVLASTQLALWLSRDAPDAAFSGGQVTSPGGMGGSGGGSGGTTTSSAEARRATALMRREITGELAGDLVALLDKAGSATSAQASGTSFAGSAPSKRDGEVSAELCAILKDFVQSRVVGDA